jgi:hypothetical protein
MAAISKVTVSEMFEVMVQICDLMSLDAHSIGLTCSSFTKKASFSSRYHRSYQIRCKVFIARKASSKKRHYAIPTILKCGSFSLVRSSGKK